MATSHIFRIMFVNQGKVYEVYARKVSHGELFGFIEVEDDNGAARNFPDVLRARPYWVIDPWQVKE